MGCGCKKALKNGEIVTSTGSRRSAVYQVVDSSGNMISEFSTPGEARKEAGQVGGRVRVTSKAG
jgi:hypothetical protein